MSLVNIGEKLQVGSNRGVLDALWIDMSDEIPLPLLPYAQNNIDPDLLIKGDCYQFTATDAGATLIDSISNTTGAFSAWVGTANASIVDIVTVTNATNTEMWLYLNWNNPLETFDCLYAGVIEAPFSDPYLLTHRVTGNFTLQLDMTNAQTATVKGFLVLQAGNV